MLTCHVIGKIAEDSEKFVRIIKENSILKDEKIFGEYLDE